MQLEVVKPVYKLRSRDSKAHVPDCDPNPPPPPGCSLLHLGLMSLHCINNELLPTF